MAPQAQLGDPKLADRKDEGLKSSEEVQKPGKNGPRKRVSQACDRCRSRKDKCDGKKPVRAFSYMYMYTYRCSGGAGLWLCEGAGKVCSSCRSGHGPPQLWYIGGGSESNGNSRGSTPLCQIQLITVPPYSKTINANGR
jgi:Fungal Zn(2)-Cys(6) binuclear cluster domain